MTDKFQTYVDSIQSKSKLKLLLVPILVTILIIILNQLLIIPFIIIFNDSLKEVLSFSGSSNLVSEAISLFLAIFLMTKISKISTEQLGFSKDNIVTSYLKGSFLWYFTSTKCFLNNILLKCNRSLLCCKYSYFNIYKNTYLFCFSRFI